ncbi:MAG: hypothetical protein OIN87_03170 [Candidatus Methanoperedens sp.]|nr:hypothetical protein [Candidatus Methanoperedens sp.]
MDTKNVTLAVVMTLSSVVLTHKWLTRLNYSSDPVIVLAAVLLIGSLAGLILSLDTRLKTIEETLEIRDRSLRINIQGVEEHLEKKMDAFVEKTNSSIGEFSKRIYR